MDRRCASRRIPRSPRGSAIPLLLWFGLASLPAAAELPASEPSQDLGPFDVQVLEAESLCEASAVISAPWNEDLVLIADNEVAKQLYVFEIEGGGLVSGKPWPMPEPKKDRPDDIEALTLLGGDLVVVGSHSRNKKCDTKEDRHRLRRLAVRSDGTLEAKGSTIDSKAAWYDTFKTNGDGETAASTGRGACLSRFFTSPPPPGADKVCDALVAAEENDSADACEVFNIEGAVRAEGDRLWVGLRAPVVEDRAILLRLTEGFEELRFDRVTTFLDLKGSRIRDLTLVGESLYGLAGPLTDDPAPFVLFRVNASDAFGGGVVEVETKGRDLVDRSEGLLIKDGRAYVVIDGDKPEEKGGPCVTPAKWYAFDLQ